MIALDTTALSLLFVPNATSRTVSGKPIRHAKERMEYLVTRVTQERSAIIVPTPSLSELVVKLGAAKVDDFLKILRASRWFRLESFDTAAAIEVGIRTAKAIAAGDKREGLKADHAKIKFDRQIVAIAMVNGAHELVSDDGDVAALGQRWGLPIKSVADLPVPPELIPPPLLAPLQDDDTPSG